MPAYLYAIRQNGDRPEGLGEIELPDDAEAIAFGKQVIRDMEKQDTHAGWAMDIAEGEREVGTVLFGSDVERS